MNIKEKNTIKDWPMDDRPREKMMRLGAESLSNAELLAIIIRTGSQGLSAIELARMLLTRFKSLRRMGMVSVEDLRLFKGLGMAKIAQLQAVFEIGKRMQEETSSPINPIIKDSKDIVAIVRARMQDLPKECFKVVLLNARNSVIKLCDITQGTVHYAHPIVREIYDSALRHHAVAFVCVHNHPSGNVTPSREDKDFTRMLQEGARYLELTLLDHIIISAESFFSFREHGLL
jgi:DNA repair protein RadC